MEVYASVDEIDPWVGLISEMHYGDGMVGESIYRILLDQFSRLMHGDAFWYTAMLSDAEVAEVETTLLSGIILRNTDINWMQPDVFLTAQRLGARGNENAVSEPATLGLACLALAGVVGSVRRRARFPSALRADTASRWSARSSRRCVGGGSIGAWEQRRTPASAQPVLVPCHTQLRISGRSSPCCSMYCLCSISLSRIACLA